MNDRDVFHLILDQPEPDFPSVVDAAVADGKRVRRRRRVAALGSAAAVLAIGAVGLGLTFAPSNHETVRPATTPPVSVTPQPTPSADLPTPSRPTPSIPGPVVSKSTGRPMPSDEADKTVGPSNPQLGKSGTDQSSRPLRCTATQARTDCGAKNGS